MMETFKEILGLILTISSALGVFSAIINKLFERKLKPLEKKIDDNELNSLTKDMEQWRFEICRFAGDLRRGVPHTRFEYESIFVFIANYEAAVERLHLHNGIFESEDAFIRECYSNLRDE